MVFIYSFPGLNRKLSFNQDFPVSSEVMHYITDMVFLVIAISKLTISLSRIHFLYYCLFFSIIMFVLFFSNELVIVLLKNQQW